jgi:glycosyltransferase involved in cell wall biosynthesis
MRILQLCSKIPFPAKDGGCLAMLNTAEMLHKNGFDVKILAMETFKHPKPSLGYPKQFEQNFAPESVFINTKINLFKAFYNLLFTRKSYHLLRFRNKQFEEKLIAVLQNFNPEIIIMDSLFTCGYIDILKLHTKAKIIYRAHNIEFQIWEDKAAKTHSVLKKAYLIIQSKRLKKEELAAIKKFDGILAITSKDTLFFEQHVAINKLMTLPFTVDVKLYSEEKEYQRNALFFIGAMDWFPNFEGVKWFIDNVWGEVLKQFPNSTFYMAGKAMPYIFKNKKDLNIRNLGEVPDAKEFMEMAPIMIAPIFSGGGLKIKIIEAMAMGKVVICNSEAAFGIPVSDKKNVLLAENAATFINQIINCFNNKLDKASIGMQARMLIEQQFDTSTKATELTDFVKRIS